MKLHRDSGEWVTEDGRFRIGKDHSVTECDNPHPVRLGKRQVELMKQALAFGLKRPEYHEPLVKEFGTQIPGEAWWAVRTGKTAYYCQGGEEHFSDSYRYIWDVEADEYLGGDLFTYGSHKEAVEVLEQHLAKRLSDEAV